MTLAGTLSVLADQAERLWVYLGAIMACSCCGLSSQGSLAVEKQAVGLDASCVQTAAHTLKQISSCLLSALLGY